MYARSTTLHGTPDRIDAGIAFVQDEVAPMAGRIDGCRGLSLLVDRESGMCIVTTSWESEEAMRSSDEQLRPMRDRGRDILGGNMQIDEWEIVVMHRARAAGGGCCARITWTRSDPAVLADVLDNLPLNLLPRLDDAEGFCSLSLFVDRATGDCSMTAVYENRHTLETSRDQVEAVREEMAEHMGMEITEVAEFELPIHHLRVPERL